MTNNIPTFENESDAIEWMVEALYADEEHCIDNIRFAFNDHTVSSDMYEEQRRNGCCGSADYHVIVAGRPASVGCNYGH